MLKYLIISTKLSTMRSAELISHGHPKSDENQNTRSLTAWTLFREARLLPA